MDKDSPHADPASETPARHAETGHAGGHALTAGTTGDGRHRLRLVGGRGAASTGTPGGANERTTGADESGPGGAAPDAVSSAAHRLFGGPRRSVTSGGVSGMVAGGAPFPTRLRGAGAVASAHEVARPGRDADFLARLQMELAEHALSPNTRRNYASHQAAWEAWCASAGVDPATASAKDVALHLTWYLLVIDASGDAVRDERGDPVAAVATSTLQVRLSAIDKAFEASGRQRPGRDQAVKTLMEGVRRLYRIAPLHARSPVLLEDLRTMVILLQEGQRRALRDVVMSELRRQTRATPGQLARLEWTDVDFSGGDAYVSLPPERRGASRRRVRVRPSARAGRCAVRSLQALHDAAGDDAPVLTDPGRRPLTRQAVDKRLSALARAGDGALDAERPSTKALRDTALLTCGWFAALRRSNMVALRWSDLTWDRGGDIRVRLRQSKTDQQGRGEWNWLPWLPDDIACPVTALSQWRDRVAELIGGDPQRLCPEAPVFPAMNRHDQLRRNARSQFRPLRGEAVNELVQRLAARVGLAGAGGHSLRAGFVTQAVLARTPLVEIAKVTHHRDTRSLAGYHRPTDRTAVDTIREMVRRSAQADRR